MDLQQELLAFRAEFAAKAPPERAKLFEAKIEELKRDFPVGQVLKAGQRAPDFTLPSAAGGFVTLSEALRSGPVVLIFYRGGWCPYCNIQLRAFQRSLGEITALGGQLLAISPQLPDGSVSTAEMDKLSFGVLSDVGNHVARSFGLVYVLPPEMQEVLTAVGKPLPAANGDDSWELPLPACFVIARDGTVTLASAELDYRERQSPEGVIAALQPMMQAAE